MKGEQDKQKSAPNQDTDVKNKALDQLAEALLEDDPKVVFLFGAGPSISAGIPGSKILKEQLWRDKLHLRPKIKVEEWFQKVGGNISEDNLDSVTLEQMMTVASNLEPGATPEEREKMLTRWLERQIPDIYTSEIRYFAAFAYEFTCHLMRCGLVKQVISMNYDELLDRAIDEEMSKGRCFKAVSLEDFELLRNDPTWTKTGYDCLLIKPHGTRSRPRSCRYRIEYVQEFEEDKRLVLERAFEDSTLVLVGYSAADNDFLNLLANLGLDRIRKIIIVNIHPDEVVSRLGGSSDKVVGYEASDEQFFIDLDDALYGKKSKKRRDQYLRLYTTAARHLIRARVYKQVNPNSKSRIALQEEVLKDTPLFFEKLNLLIEILIYCAKVRGLFTRKALSTCPRIVAALATYLEKAQTNENPIEETLKKLEQRDKLGNLRKDPIIIRKAPDEKTDISLSNTWFYIPHNNSTGTHPVFDIAAGKLADFLATELEQFFDKSGKERDKFVEYIQGLLAKLPYDFDYDLSKDLSLYFLPFNNIQRITNRREFRERTEEILKCGKDYSTLYVISPSVAEWLTKFGDHTIDEITNIKVIINKNVYEVNGSLHFIHISGTLSELRKKGYKNKNVGWNQVWPDTLL